MCVTMLRIKEASTLLGVHPQTLRRWEKDGKLIPSKTPNGQRRYSKEDTPKKI